MAAPNINVVIRGLRAGTERIVQALSLEVTANLKKAPSEGGTPVDTGWARVNWVPTIGSPFSGTAGTRKQAESGSIDRSTSAAGEASLLGYKLARGQVFISNNVPYIGFLNNGSSKQAPRGFVQRAIQRAIDRLSGGKLL